MLRKTGTDSEMSTMSLPRPQPDEAPAGMMAPHLEVPVAELATNSPGFGLFPDCRGSPFYSLQFPTTSAAAAKQHTLRMVNGSSNLATGGAADNYLQSGQQGSLREAFGQDWSSRSPGTWSASSTEGQTPMPSGEAGSLVSAGSKQDAGGQASRSYSGHKDWLVRMRSQGSSLPSWPSYSLPHSCSLERDLRCTEDSQGQGCQAHDCLPHQPRQLSKYREHSAAAPDAAISRGQPACCDRGPMDERGCSSEAEGAERSTARRARSTSVLVL